MMQADISFENTELRNSDRVSFRETYLEKDRFAETHSFIVHYLNEQKKIKNITFNCANEIIQHAFACFDRYHFNENNAILTYFDSDENLTLLTTVPSPLEDGQAWNLYIKYVSPICFMCSNPFGIIDEELLLECPNDKCSQQYCSSCVNAIRGASCQYPFACADCKQNVTPKRNKLIEEYLIWPNLGKLYGTRSLLSLKNKSDSLCYQSVLTDIKLRYTHLQSRLCTFSQKFRSNFPPSSKDEELVTSAEDICQKLTIILAKTESLKKEIGARQTTISLTLEKYKKGMKHFDDLCDKMLTTIQEIENVQIDTVKEYHMDELQALPSESNIFSIDKILDDVAFRSELIWQYYGKVKVLFETHSLDKQRAAKNFEKVEKMISMLKEMKETLLFFRQKCVDVSLLIDEYFSLLSDQTIPNIPNSRFILLMERLRIRIEKIEVACLFPQTIQLMSAWENDYGIDDSFKPKLIDLCQAVENDIKTLYDGTNYTCSIPFKIGAIGDTSAGKSALIKTLSNTEHTSVTILSQRSTFGYLQIDTVLENPKSKLRVPFSFFDIEGAIDNDLERALINYFDIITKTDCDLYMIVYDKPLTAFNLQCFDYVTNVLQRKCIFVRSKSDILFRQLYQDENGHEYNKESCRDDVVNVDNVLRKMRTQAKITYKDEELFHPVFLTAAGQNNDLNETKVGKFDLEKVKQMIFRLALNDCRIKRIYRLAVLLSKHIVNTCFRRGYAVSQGSYRLLSAGLSIIPFADEISNYMGKNKICQALGAYDNSTAANAPFQKDRVQEYLIQHKFIIPKGELKSGCFQYLIAKDSETTKSVANEIMVTSISSENQTDNSMYRTRISSASVTLASMAAIRVSDDVIRATVPVAVGTVRAASVVGILTGAILTPVIATWAFVNTGKCMNNYLHQLCDDFQCVLQYFIANVCNQSCRHIQAMFDASFSNDEYSSSDED
ncbi:unnamed protein product [Adineta ricciae]|uniref:Uncharacterized protein n=1 Tax=Adineta ricciae TaxID=249248 RepID=A0A814MGG5_ADIRI|nr:unnamed protein product [Adineta ricciae]CAF1077593.1 unnamed protein product [Adineta ricciae]